MYVMLPEISKITFGRNASPFGIGQARPTISWRFSQQEKTVRDFTQSDYELRVRRTGSDHTYAVSSESNIDAPWPQNEPDLGSREKATVGVRVKGGNGEWTDWLDQQLEASLFKSEDWKAKMITSDLAPPASLTKRPIYLRTRFDLSSKEIEQLAASPARIYATAFGVYSLSINGHRVGDHVLAPGWQAYQHRLHFQTYEVPSDFFQVGANVIGISVGEGWYAGRLTWMSSCRNYWGSDIGARCQLELGDKCIATNVDEWQWDYGPLISSGLYDGVVYDGRLEDEDWSLPTSKDDWKPTRELPISNKIELVAPEAPPIRRIQEVRPIEKIITPSGKKVLDFGQNLVGWVKIKTVPANDSRFPMSVVLKHAEVLEKGELGVRPLRTAKATDQVFMSSKPIHDWEPEFTTHGFRYVQIDGCDVEMDNFVAVVVHSDMERLGDFECSHPVINKLHQNVVWGLKGNFVGVPTDCPQRDERMGWTGDLQAFAPTACFLYDTSGMLANWLHDLVKEQMLDNRGVPPLVVPAVMDMADDPKPFPQAVWGDVCTLTPTDMYEAYGSRQILEETWESMTTWLDTGIPKSENGLWENVEGAFQLADWLDPRAPPDDPAAAMTDPVLVADEFLLHVTKTVSRIGRILGKEAESARYEKDYERRLKAFHELYVAPSGRMSSDAQTAYVLALAFDLLTPEQSMVAAERLARLVGFNMFRIGTGFAGTPGILNALAKSGHLQVAYRMLQERSCPSWLYPITMGATTIWERWDAMLPDGSINPGEMTSFNHYALGSTAHFLHSVVAGLSPAEPGWKVIDVSPRPGGTVTSAKAHHITPYGKVSCAWELKDGKMSIEVEVPPNTRANVHVPGLKETVGSGFHHFEVEHTPEGHWPPVSLAGPSRRPREQTFIP